MSSIYSHQGLQFQFSEPLPPNAENSPQFLLVAMLCGAVSISVGPRYRRLANDFTAIPAIEQKRRNGRAIVNLFQNYDVGCTSPEFVTRTLADNRGFYQELLAEFYQYFFQMHRGAHTAAFVFLYRIVERLSYSIPLLYVSTTKDYVGTFRELKSLFADEKSGEHGFFKKFLNQGSLIDLTILDQVYVLDFSFCAADEQKYINILNKVYKGFQPAGATLNGIGCKFRDILDFLVAVRNRFFHTRTGDGQPNISLKSLGDPDELFRAINPVFCSFLAVVTMHSVAKKYRH